MKVCVFLLAKQKDIVNVSERGISVLDVGLSHLSDKRVVENQDHPGNFQLMHCLESFDFLKLEKSNFIMFECQDTNHKVFKIQQEYLSTN